MSLLRQCGTAKLLRACGTGKLLRACTPPAPKDICTEFGLNPELSLKLTWSGTLTRCTDCWDLDSRNHWLCTAAPTSLPNFPGSNNCLGPSAALPSAIILEVYLDYCGGYSTDSNSDWEVSVLWSCVDGLFQLAVYSSYNIWPMFYAAAYDVKDGDVLVNQLTCLSWPTLPCGATSSFPAFVTGGSYKVEIVT